MNLADVFVMEVPFLESVVRGAVMYIVLVIMMRCLGQREAGGLDTADVLVIVLVATAATPGLIDASAGLVDAVIVIATILLMSVALDAIAFRFPRFARIVKGRPRVLIKEGEIQRRALRRELMSDDELATQLRLHGIERAEEVARALLEPNGMVSIRRADDDPADEPGRPPAI